jgi:hypothetical protein
VYNEEALFAFDIFNQKCKAHAQLNHQLSGVLLNYLIDIGVLSSHATDIHAFII